MVLGGAWWWLAVVVNVVVVIVTDHSSSFLLVVHILWSVAFCMLPVVLSLRTRNRHATAIHQKIGASNEKRGYFAGLGGRIQ